MDPQAPRAYTFARFRVDLSQQRVLGPEETVLSLSSRAYDALVYLIESRARVVSKEELMKAVWPRAIVEENNLNQAVSSLRRALGDSRESPRFILTVAGRGYRFVADVNVDHDDSPQTSSRMPQSIAVLPFQPIVANARNEALEFGMAETLINRLSGLPGAVVAPLSSVRRYAKPDQDPVSAGRDLAVAAVLHGHVQVQQDHVRVTARLLDVRNGSALWSGQFDERLSEFFAMQDSLAQQVVEALSLDLSEDARRRLYRRETENVEAWQLYLNARYHWDRKSDDGFRRAIEFYSAAMELDPQFALPAAGLADVWAVFGVFNIMPPVAAFSAARAVAQRAIALDGQLAEAHAALGHVMVQADRDWKGGERLYRLALALKPRYAQAVMWLANNHCYQGRIRDALAAAQQAQALEPMSVTFAANVGMIRYFARDFAAAHDQLASLVEAAPQFAVARHHLARVHMARGDASKALALLEGYSQRAPGSLSNLGRALALNGKVDAARRELAGLEALGEQGFGVGYDVALIWTALGEHEQALSALERAVGDGSQTIGFMNSEPGLDPIRDHPRFRAVSQRLGLG